MKISIYIATSLDGFIARTDGDIEWLFYFNDPNDKEDYGYAEFMASIDSIVMGRKTLEKTWGFTLIQALDSKEYHPYFFANQ